MLNGAIDSFRRATRSGGSHGVAHLGEPVGRRRAQERDSQEAEDGDENKEQGVLDECCSSFVTTGSHEQGGQASVPVCDHSHETAFRVVIGPWRGSAGLGQETYRQLLRES